MPPGSWDNAIAAPALPEPGVGWQTVAGWLSHTNWLPAGGYVLATVGVVMSALLLLKTITLARSFFWG